MSNADTTATHVGGNPATSGLSASLPARIRVHALAKLLDVNSKDVLRVAGELGESARSAQSSVSREVAVRLADALSGTTQRGTAQQNAAPAQQTLNLSSPELEPKAAPAAQVPPALAAPAPVEKPAKQERPLAHMPIFAAPSPVFLPPEPVSKVRRSTRPEPRENKAVVNSAAPVEKARVAEQSAEEPKEISENVEADKAGDDSARVQREEEAGRRRRRRGRRGRGRGKAGDEVSEETGDEARELEDSANGNNASAGNNGNTNGSTSSTDNADESKDAPKSEHKNNRGKEESTQENEAPESDDDEDSESATKRRRRRRRRKSEDDTTDSAEAVTQDDPPNTVVHVREAKSESPRVESEIKSNRDGVRSVRGSTRLEAKRQRRRDGREAGRRRAPILSEAEFLARRESVNRTMVVSEKGPATQIGVLEDGVLVEHFVTSSSGGSIGGNVYLGRVQNVLPSMEAAFVDIGRGRNAVLYAGEVDWDAAGLEGKSRKIEQALSSGDSVLVQVTKDPIGHKGARLTTQISLPGRFLVYVPGGGATGISRKLPENERRRLKDLLKNIVPEDAGVIIRTASEGVSEEELHRDVRRLQAQWEVIKEKAEQGRALGKKSGAPTLLYEEPDLLVKVVRDLFTEDFVKLEIQGNTAWETIHAYVTHVAPDLADRLKRYVGTGDVFADHRIDEQITKALDRKVWLPSGGYLVIDRTEAMTVIDVNTGKFTGSGGNLEETVTRNNLESAEEIVRQLRLRDIGGIIVIDFIDMVLESNRELVLRRLTECLGRDRTRHQVAEVTSLGLVQMTRKKIGTGLLEAFSTNCEHCKGRGVIVSTEPLRSGGPNGHVSAHGNGQPSGQPSGQVSSSAQVSSAASSTSAPSGNAPSSNAPSNNAGGGNGSGSANSANSTGSSENGGSRSNNGSQSSRRNRGRERSQEKPRVEPVVASEPAKVEEAPAVSPPEHRESVVSAVQAVANASKVAAARATEVRHTPSVSSNVEAKIDNRESGKSAAVTKPAPVEPLVLESDVPESSRPSRRRPRRAASRPAGPPVADADKS